ncbi:MAG TPA: hypothetical protein VMG55_00135 [Stellaceae bacterium]|nr:hypothetical protein [Stellaceae bacterium]
MSALCEPAALSALLLRIPTPRAPILSTGSIFAAKGEASTEGFRPDYYRLPERVEPAPLRVLPAYVPPAQTRLWLRLDKGRHARLKAAARARSATARAILAQVATRALLGPAPATASAQTNSPRSRKPLIRVKLSIIATVDERTRLKSAAKALGTSCQALLTAALDIEFAKHSAPVAPLAKAASLYFPRAVSIG